MNFLKKLNDENILIDVVKKVKTNAKITVTKSAITIKVEEKQNVNPINQIGLLLSEMLEIANSDYNMEIDDTVKLPIGDFQDGIYYFNFNI